MIRNIILFILSLLGIFTSVCLFVVLVKCKDFTNVISKKQKLLNIINTTWTICYLILCMCGIVVSLTLNFT